MRPWTLGLSAPPSDGPADASAPPTPTTNSMEGNLSLHFLLGTVRNSLSSITHFQTFLLPRPVPAEDLEEAGAEGTRKKVVWAEAGEIREAQSMLGLYCWPWQSFYRKNKGEATE